MRAVMRLVAEAFAMGALLVGALYAWALLLWSVQP